MKNRDLIEKLRELPDEAEVRVCGEGLDARVSAVEFFRPGNTLRIWVDPARADSRTTRIER
jgi:hypothetical protein